MATAAHIELTTSTPGAFHVPSLSATSAAATSSLLQQNHDSYHIFYAEGSFHNHIAHHLLALYPLGADPSELQSAYTSNASYQRPQYTLSQSNVAAMSDPTSFATFLGKQAHYNDFLHFFASEITTKGWQATLQEHLFAHTPHSENMLVRMYAGFYHPLIHLGYGIEFAQPAIIAEALAQAAIHDRWPAAFLLGAEGKAKSSSPPNPPRTLVSLIKEIQQSKKLRESVKWDDGNKVRDGILVRAPEEMIDVASKFVVKAEDLKKRTAEMIDTTIYFSAGAQRKDKEVKFDFFYMHCVNASIFFSTFAEQEWMKIEDRVRMLEWKGRFDLAMYLSRGCPEINMDEVRGYQPKHPDQRWEEIVKRVNKHQDDGHAAKLIRAVGNGKKVCGEFEGQEGFEVGKESGDWEKVLHMVIDSVERTEERVQKGEPRWARNVGWDEGWMDVSDRARL